MKKILLTIAVLTAAVTLSAQKARLEGAAHGRRPARSQGTWANNNATPLERPSSSRAGRR